MLHVFEGVPGSGKTTAGLQFLLEGTRRNERVLFVSLLQSRKDLEILARSHGWSLDHVGLMGPPKEISTAIAASQTLFSPADIELPKMTELILRSIARHKPQRLVFDSISDLALLVDSAGQLQRQVLRLKRGIDELGCTALFTTNESHPYQSAALETLAHGVVELGVRRTPYGPPERWLEVTKMRALEYLEGRHACRIKSGGLEVFTRSSITEADRSSDTRCVLSGNEGLDALLGGGLQYASTCQISGTPGSGKSTLSAQYVHSAATRGNRAIVYCFDERRDIYLRRAAAMGIDLMPLIRVGRVEIRQHDDREMSLGEFASRMGDAIDRDGANVLVFDSLNGLLCAMEGENSLMPQLHQLLNQAAESGALVLMPSTLARDAPAPLRAIQASNLTDVVLLVRSFDSGGLVRRCVAVIKKRYGGHERSVRELLIGPDGITVGPPLRSFDGLLTDSPRYTGELEALLPEDRGRGGRKSS